MQAMEPMDQKRHDELQKDLITGEPGDRDHPGKPGFYGWLINNDYPQLLDAADKLELDTDQTDGDRLALPTHRLLRTCLSSRKQARSRVNRPSLSGARVPLVLLFGASKEIGSGKGKQGVCG